MPLHLRTRKHIILGSLLLLVAIQGANLIAPDFFTVNKTRDIGFSLASVALFFLIGYNGLMGTVNAMMRVLPNDDAGPNAEKTSEAIIAIQQVFESRGINTTDAFLYANHSMDLIEAEIERHVFNPNVDVAKPR